MVHVVQERGNILEYPPEIPAKRSFRDVRFKIYYIVFLVAASVCATTYPQWENTYLLSTFALAICIFHELEKRTFSLVEERYHIMSRYENSKLNLLKAAYEFNMLSALTVSYTIFSIFVVCYVLKFNIGNFISLMENNVIPLTFLHKTTLLFQDIIKLNECPMNSARQIDDSLGLDYGCGIAHSYFEGYLNIILPDFGDERIGLSKKIDHYESKHGVCFGAKKIYILIPLSGKCPPKMNTESKIAEHAGSLESRVIDRAGTQDRVYHASVYKLTRREGERPIYVCAEYATPLKTLNEVMNRNSEEAARYKRYYPELVTNFYVTLRKLVKKNIQHCELIYYKDTDSEGNPLATLDVGRLILDRMDADLK